MVRLIVSTKAGIRPSVGSSISKSLGSVPRLRAIVSICCSPPLRVAPLVRQPLRRAAETARRLEPGTRPSAGRRRRWSRAMLRFSYTLKFGKIRRSSGTYPIPGAPDPVRRQPRDVGAVPRDAPPPRPHHRHDRLQRRRLPRSIPPQQSHRLPRPHSERDILQHMAQPVIRIDTFHVQHRGRPVACGAGGGWAGRRAARAGGAPSWRAVVAVRAPGSASEPPTIRLATPQPPLGDGGPERAEPGASYGDRRAMPARRRRARPAAPAQPPPASQATSRISRAGTRAGRRRSRGSRRASPQPRPAHSSAR